VRQHPPEHPRRSAAPPPAERSRRSQRAAASAFMERRPQPAPRSMRPPDRLPPQKPDQDPRDFPDLVAATGVSRLPGWRGARFSPTACGHQRSPAVMSAPTRAATAISLAVVPRRLWVSPTSGILTTFLAGYRPGARFWSSTPWLLALRASLASTWLVVASPALRAAPCATCPRGTSKLCQHSRTPLFAVFEQVLTWAFCGGRRPSAGTAG